MKKIALFTINGNNNYGNKLQHYGTQQYMERLGFQVETIKFKETKKIIVMLKRKIKNIIKNSIKKNIKEILYNYSSKRYHNFVKFDELIKYSKTYIYKDKIHNSINYNYYVVGSDQVWNTHFHTFSRFY